MLDGTHI